MDEGFIAMFQSKLSSFVSSCCSCQKGVCTGAALCCAVQRVAEGAREREREREREMLPRSNHLGLPVFRPYLTSCCPGRAFGEFRPNLLPWPHARSVLTFLNLLDLFPPVCWVLIDRSIISRTFLFVFLHKLTPTISKG